MPVRDQVVNINFLQGLDTKSDPYSIPLGKFQALSNSNFSTGGRLTKRNGFQGLSTSIASTGTFTNKAFGANITSGVDIASYQGEYVLLDGLGLYSYSGENQNWVYKGRCETVSVNNKSIVKNQYHQFMPTSAINTTTNLELFVFENLALTIGADGSGVSATLKDLSTGQNVLNSLNASLSGIKPKAFALGSNLYLIYYDAPSTLVIYPVTEAGFGTPVSIIADVNSSNPNYDVLVVGSILYIVYNQTSNIVINSYNTSLALQHTATLTGSSATNNISIFSDTSNNIWVPFSTTSTVSYAVFSPVLGITLAATAIDSGSTAASTYNITGCYDGTIGYIFYDQLKAPNEGVQLASLAADFTQPQVQAAVTITIGLLGSTPGLYAFVGQTIAIFDSNNNKTNWYSIRNVNADGTVDIINLGLAGGTAPGSTVHGSSLNPYIVLIDNADYSQINYNTAAIGGTFGTPAVYQNQAILSSKAFVVGTIPHVSAVYVSSLQGTYFLTALYNTWSLTPNVAKITAKFADQLSEQIPRRRDLAQVNLYNSKYEVALPQIGFIASTTSLTVTGFAQQSVAQSVIYGVQSFLYNFSPTEVSTLELAQNLHIGKGSVLMYDGANVVEHGFNINPGTITAVTATAGDMAAGSYGYAFVFQWTDNQGQRHQSAPKFVGPITVMATGSVTFTIDTIRLTSKTNITIAVYRTLVNGTTYQRIDSGPGQYVYNDLALATVAFVDIYNDTTIEGNEVLYTSGQVANQVVPATYALAAYKNRAIALVNQTPFAFWYSQQVITQNLGSTPVEFSQSFVENVGTIGGNLIAAIAMDDKLILFKSETIYYLSGTGPAPSGAGNDFSDPILVTTDCGCIDSASLVVMPLGIMFKSKKGIYLLDRSLSANYLGAPVESFNQYNVNSGVLIPQSNQVRMGLTTTALLAYDYFYNQWNTYTIPTATVSAAIIGGYQGILTAAGLVGQETPNTYLDALTNSTTQPVTMAFTTGWINVAGLQGYERLKEMYLLGTYISPHTLTIQVAYDYNSSIAQTVVITPDASKPIEQWRIFFARQKCEAIQITVTENYTGTPGAALTISGIALVIGVKSGYPRLAPVVQAG